MKMKRIYLGAALVALSAAAAWAGGSKEETVRTGSHGGDTLVLRVTPGEHYLHDLKVSWWLTVRNAPQMAVWMETLEGEYIRTLYVTDRAATQNWRAAPLDGVAAGDIRRPSALPVWRHRARLAGDATVESSDPFETPSIDIDAVSAATTKRALILHATMDLPAGPCVVMLEVNSSTDFNDAYPQDVEPGASGYSGGPWGSGQPALIYAAVVEPVAAGAVELELIGHSSPDGSDGDVRSGVADVTTATSILERVTIEVVAGT